MADSQTLHDIPCPKRPLLQAGQKAGSLFGSPPMVGTSLPCTGASNLSVSNSFSFNSRCPAKRFQVAAKSKCICSQLRQGELNQRPFLS